MVNQASFRVEKISPGENLEKVYRIRKVVFIEEQQIPAELDLDGKDKDSLHVLVIQEPEQQAVGTGRLTLSSSSLGVLSRISVLADWRGKGLGKLIIAQLESYAEELGIRSLQLAPHQYLEEFYQSLGYEVVPAKASKAGPHALILMKKEFPPS